MKLVYIAHPFQGKGENREKVGDICRLLAKGNMVPISPIHSFAYLNDNIPEERITGIEYCKQLLAKCDELWIFGDWLNSEGCKMEFRFAGELGLPIMINPPLRE